MDDLGPVDECIEKGDFSGIREWLVRNVHTKGALLLPGNLMMNVTGKMADASYFLEYLKGKYGQ